MKEKALNLIKKLYNTSDGGAGGYGHIVFDDGNIENEHIRWCIAEAKKGEYGCSEETKLASIKALEYFLKLTENERQEVYEKFWIEN